MPKIVITNGCIEDRKKKEIKALFYLVSIHLEKQSKFRLLVLSCVRISQNEFSIIEYLYIGLYQAVREKLTPPQPPRFYGIIKKIVLRCAHPWSV